MPEDNRLLVVEDDDIIRKELCENLEFEGYQVDSAKNGKEALDKVGKMLYLVIITDLVMPGEIDKLELLQEIKKKAPDVRLIVITGILTTPEVFIKARSIGIYDYLVKKLNFDHLRTAIKEAIEGKDICEEFHLQIENFLYEMYGKKLEKDHKGEFVAINFDGEIIMDLDDGKVLEEALKRFGGTNFIFKRIGYHYVYEV